MLVRLFATQALTPTAIALGNFDGLHLGHNEVLQPVLDVAKSTGLIPTVVSFDPHPQEFFTGKQKKLLTTVTEKTQQLQKLGMEQLVLLPFNQELAELTPQEFVAEILVKQLQAQSISVGEDFCFGCNRTGNARMLQLLAASYNIRVCVTSLKKCSPPLSLRISSSLIRQALETGDLRQVKEMLGRPYTLTGTVISGQKLGREIGFPTANLEVSKEKFLPKTGVYSVRSQLGTKEYVGVMNLGCRPTVSGDSTTVEVHLLDWVGDLYGKTLTVSLEKYLRPEQKFSSLEALKTQIAADCQTTRELFSNIL